MNDPDGASSDELPTLEGHTESEQSSDDDVAAAVGAGHAAGSRNSSTTSSSMPLGMPNPSAQHQQRHGSSARDGIASSSSMMDGLNRNSRIWQVPEGDDPHEHALGPAPDEGEQHAMFQMPHVQFMPGMMGAAGGQVVLSMPVPAAFANMRNQGGSSAPEPMFLPGGGTGGPPLFQGMLGSMAMRPPQQQQPRPQPVRAAGAGRSPQRDHLAEMLSSMPRRPGPLVIDTLNRRRDASAATRGGANAARAGASGSSSSTNHSSNAHRGVQPVPRLVSSAGTVVPVVLTQGLNTLTPPLVVFGTPPSSSSLLGSPPSGSRPRLIARRHRPRDANSSSSPRGSSNSPAARELPNSFQFAAVPRQAAAAAAADNNASSSSTATQETQQPGSSTCQATGSRLRIASSGSPAGAGLAGGEADSDRDDSGDTSSHWWRPWQLLLSGFRLLQQLLVGMLSSTHGVQVVAVGSTATAAATSGPAATAAAGAQVSAALLASNAAAFPASFRLREDQPAPIQQQQQAGTAPAPGLALAEQAGTSLPVGLSPNLLADASGVVSNPSSSSMAARLRRQRQARGYGRQRRQMRHMAGDASSGSEDDDVFYPGSGEDDEPPSSRWVWPAPPAVATAGPAAAAAASTAAFGSAVAGSSSSAAGRASSRAAAAAADSLAHRPKRIRQEDGLDEELGAAPPAGQQQQSLSPQPAAAGAGAGQAGVSADLSGRLQRTELASDEATSDGMSDMPPLLTAADSADEDTAVVARPAVPHSAPAAPAAAAAAGPAAMGTGVRLSSSSGSLSSSSQLPLLSDDSDEADDMPALVAGTEDGSSDGESDGGSSAHSSAASLVSSDASDDALLSDDEVPPELDDPDDSDASCDDALMPDLECGTEEDEEDGSSESLSDSDDNPPELEATECSSSGSDEEPPPLEPADVEVGMRAGDSSSSDAEEDEAVPSLVDAGSDDDSMPDLEAASDAEDRPMPGAQHTMAAAAARPGSTVAAAGSSSSRGRGRGSSSSGFRRGFLGAPLQQSSWSGEQRQQLQQQREMLQAVQALARTAVGEGDDEGSDGSWETASNEHTEHAEAASNTAGDGDDDDDYTDEEEYTDDDDEDCDDDDDDDDMQCYCPQCQRMRALAALQPDAAGSSSSRADHRNGTGSLWGRQQGPAVPDLAQSLLSNITQSRQGPAADAAFSRQRSNGFVVPGTSSSNDTTDSAAQGAATQHAEARMPKGLPPLQRPRSNRPGDAAAATSSSRTAAPAVPPGLLASADAKQLVQQVGDALSDSSFTQELLAGLPGVDPASSSVRQALQLLQGKAWAPAKQATAAAGVVGRKGFLVAYEEVVFRVNAQQAARLVARWRHY